MYFQEKLLKKDIIIYWYFIYRCVYLQRKNLQTGTAMGRWVWFLMYLCRFLQWTIQMLWKVVLFVFLLHSLIVYNYDKNHNSRQTLYNYFLISNSCTNYELIFLPDIDGIGFGGPSGASHWKLTCSRHNIAEKLLSCVRQQSLTHSFLGVLVSLPH